MTFLLVVVACAIGFYFLSKHVLMDLAPMLLNVVKIIFVVLILVAVYVNYTSVSNKIKLEKDITSRKAVVIERLEQVKEAQINFKKVKGFYAGSFEQLTHFLMNDSLVYINAIGEVPDSLLGQEAKALELGIISRDTALIAVRDELFQPNFQQVVDSLSFIPFSGKKKFKIESGEIEKGKVKVKVFEVNAPYTDIFRGLKTDNEGIDMTKSLTLGSMVEPTINGNWD